MMRVSVSLLFGKSTITQAAFPRVANICRVYYGEMKNPPKMNLKCSCTQRNGIYDVVFSYERRYGPEFRVLRFLNKVQVNGKLVPYLVCAQSLLTLIFEFQCWLYSPNLPCNHEMLTLFSKFQFSSQNFNLIFKISTLFLIRLHSRYFSFNLEMFSKFQLHSWNCNYFGVLILFCMKPFV